MNFEEAIKQVSLYEKNKFPTEAVEYILLNQDLFENKFIEILRNYADDPKLYDIDKDDHVISLLFLSQFQSKKAFPVLLDLLKTLPYSDEMDQPFGDIITEIVPPALAACFNGDLEITLDLLCSKDSYLFARLAALSMLEICIFTEKLTEQEVLDFYDKIVERLYTQDKEDEFLQDCMDELAGISLPKMETTLIKYSITLNEEKKIEINYLRKKDNRYYLTDKDRSMKSYNALITNGMKVIETWNISTSHEESILHSYDFENEDFFISDERTQPKIGRNNPCLCGSGKKFKKCCLQ